MDQALAELFSLRKKGWSLPREFYAREDLFAEEMQRIFFRSWLMVGHACEIREPGDYLTFEIGTDSIVIIRQDDGGIKAFFNTCRHRGSRLLEAARGKAKAILCPYHQWNYSRDGKLVGCPSFEGQIDRNDFSLHACEVVNVAGLLFLCLDPERAPSFADARTDIESRLKAQGLDRAKIAFEETYDVKANWKLVWENNRECYHCRVGHPEYSQCTYDAALPDDQRTAAEVKAAYEAVEPKWRAAGIEPDFLTGGVPYFPTPGVFWRSMRLVLRKGWVTQSLDGKPVSRLMGDYRDPDMGTLRVSTLPNLWNHSMSDYSMSTRLVPVSPSLTRVTVSWLVHEDAVEGKDYDVERLTFIWKQTGEQDWRLSETNHLGVKSSRYTPGPYSLKREYNVDRFVDWYEESMKR